MTALDEFDQLEEDQLLAVERQYEWIKQARPNQLLPHDDWTLWLLMAGRGFGKALALDTPIPTSRGFKTMGNLEEGDELYDELGNPCRVVRVHPVLFGRACYRVSFDDGSQVTCDEEHLWPVIDQATRNVCREGETDWLKYFDQYHHVKTTGQLAKDYILPNGGKNYVVPCTRPIRYRPKRLELDPYLLGCWLGDGHSEANRITVADKEIMMAFKRDGFTVTVIDSRSEAVTYGITVNKEGNSFQTTLKRLKLWGNKHVPDIYKLGSIEQRTDLLQGLLDTDGYADKHGQAIFDNTNKKLAMDVFELVAGLGFKARFADREASLDGRVTGRRYSVTFVPQGNKVFRLRRKQMRVELSGKKQINRRQVRYIASIEKVDSVPVRCITVDSPNRLYLCGHSAIPTHNTRTGAEKAREWLTMLPELRMGIMGPTRQDTQKTMIEGDSGLLSVIPDKLISDYNKKDLEIRLTNGSIIQGYTAEEPDRLRGPQFHRFWLDEPAAMRLLRQVKDQISFSLRLKHPLSQKTQQIWTTTPRPTPLVKEIVKDSKVPGSRIFITTGSSYENRENLTEEFFAALVKEYEGTTLGRQEIHAELIDASETGIFKKTWFKFWPSDMAMPTFQFILVSLDTAFTDKTENDPSAATIWGAFRHPGTGEQGIMLLGCWNEHLAYPDLRKKVIKMANTFYGDTERTRGMRPGLFLIEDKGSGITLRQDLKRAGIILRAYNPGKADKTARAHVVAPLVRDGVVFIPENAKRKGEEAEWATKFLEEITSFPDGVEHDDYVDTFTQMLAIFRDMEMTRQAEVADDMDDEDEESDGPTTLAAYKRLNPYAR